MVQAIVDEVDPELIYLFGSQARGNPGPNSDIDLLIVEREPFEPRRSRLQEINRIYRAVTRFRVPTDVLLYSADEFSQWRHSTNHVVGRCCREGKVLYERR
jgi:predicted nucleotidyltransferase